MRIREVNEAAFARDVVRAPLPVLVNFYAAWCSFSLELGPIVEKLAVAVGKQAKVVRVNFDANPKLCARLGVQRIPTQLLFADGAVRDKIFGRASFETLLDATKAAIVSSKKLRAAAEWESKEISDLNFSRHVLQSESPVLVLFWDRQCKPSLDLDAQLAKITARQRSGATIVRVQASLAPETCARFQVNRFPLIAMFRDGEVVDYIGGAASRETITGMLQANA